MIFFLAENDPQGLEILYTCYLEIPSNPGTTHMYVSWRCPQPGDYTRNIRYLEMPLP